MFALDALRVLAAAAVIASPSPSPSAQPPEITHVVTTDRVDETLQNTTRTTYVVSAAQIARHGYRTVGDALASIPGVEINRYGPIGANVSYGIRGSSSAQVLVLIDGVPAPGGFANSVQFGTMSTAGIHRIEVVEGGGSTLYGAGAIGGIINVITSEPRAFSSDLRYGTFDDAQLRVQAGGFSAERVVANNGYDQHPNGDYEATTLRYGAKRTFGNLGVAFNASAENDRLGAPGPYPAFSTTSREADVNQLASVQFSLKRPHATPTLQIFASKQQITFACDATSDPNCFFPVPALNTETRTGLSFRNAVSSSNARTIYGIDLSRGVVRGDDGAGDISSDALAQSAAYVQENWQLPHGNIYAGLRGERDGSLGGELSPSAGYRVALGETLLKVNLAHAFRAPNASELYFPGYGNPSLVAERAVTGDVALSDAHVLGGVTLGWFSNYTKNLIIANPNDNYAPENVAQARMQGFTLDARTKPLHGTRATVSVTDLYRAEDLYLQTRLPDDPVFSVDLGLEFLGGPRSNFNDAGISVRSVGARGAYDPTQPPFFQAVPYTTVDAFARFNLSRRVRLALRGYNLGNERYAEVAGYPMPGRSFAVEVTTK